jgi:26S proteasome regulatory subunit N11
MEPPANVKADPWAKLAAKRTSLFIESNVFEVMRRAAKDGAGSGHEVLGLLVGDMLQPPGGGPGYTVALAHATSPVQASATHVRFDPAKFDALARSLEALPFDYLIVGWFHSHLGLGCFLSETDRRTQQRFFSSAHQFALVLDPVLEEAGAFQLGEGRTRELPFTLFENGGRLNPDYRLFR